MPLIALAMTLALAAPEKTGRLPVNGLSYYYEVSGSGAPLLLLHGRLDSIEAFGPVLPQLAEGRQVIAVDLQGHGRTALGTRPFRVELIANDMAELVKRLGYERLDVMGISLGGEVALRLAVQHPERVRKLVLASTSYSNAGRLPEHDVDLDEASIAAMMQTPRYELYARVAPKPGEFRRLIAAVGELDRIPYDWSGELSRVHASTLLVYADHDAVRLDHAVKLFQLLSNGRDTRLAILPNLTYPQLSSSPQLAAAVQPFLDEKPRLRRGAPQSQPVAFIPSCCAAR